jgi:hypothetical protein
MVGEHIRTRKGGRWTHAIDCGDATVIHLDRNGAGTARVLRTYRPEFVAGAEAVEVVTHRERTFGAREIVARALSRLSFGGLAAMFHDSEAFAEWCATGRLPPAPTNVAIAAPEAASARAAPKPRSVPKAKSPEAKSPRAKAPEAKAPRAKSPEAKAPRAKAPDAKSPRAKARRSAARTAAPKRAARKASAPARRKPARRGASASAKRRRRR